MPWTNLALDYNNYIHLDLDDFLKHYPGVIDDEIATIKRVQDIFKIFEDSNYRHSLPRTQAARVDDLKTKFIDRILKPMINYNPRTGKSFGGYTVEEFVTFVKQCFEVVYSDLSGWAALLRSEHFDHNLLDKLADKDVDTAFRELQDMLKELGTLSGKFPSIVKKIDRADKVANEWLEKQNKVIEKLIEAKSRELDVSAESHRGAIQLFWMSMAGALGLLAFFLGYAIFDRTLTSPTTEVTFGFGLLKLSSVVAPLAAAYVCYTQYAYHRSMYDALRFRAIALSNLATLSKQYPDSKDLIFARGIDLIFDEPRAKHASVRFRDITDLVKAVKS